MLSACQVSFGTFPPFSAHVLFFHISYYLTITLVSAPASFFSLAVPMHEVYCVGYSPRAWAPRSLQSMLDDSFYSRLVVMDPQSARITTTTTFWTILLLLH